MRQALSRLEFCRNDSEKSKRGTGKIVGACSDCGEKAGMGKNRCASCTSKEERRLAAVASARQAEREILAAKEQVERIERQKQEEINKKARRVAYLEQRTSGLLELIQEGVTPYLYDSLIVDSYSFFNESPNPGAWSFKTTTAQVGTKSDLSDLRSRGLAGWEVIQSIPITFGSTLYNNSGGNTIFAAAHSGLVVGANLILRLPITVKTIREQPEWFEQLLIAEFPG